MKTIKKVCKLNFSLYLFFLLSFLCGYFKPTLLICLVLFFQFLLLLKNEKYYLQRFYLERFLNDYPYKRIENDYVLEKKKLKKETKHYFYTNHHFIDEKKMLAREYE